MNVLVQNACKVLVDRLAPIREANPKGTWTDWVLQAYFERISLSSTGFYKYIFIINILKSFMVKRVLNKGLPISVTTWRRIAAGLSLIILSVRHVPRWKLIALRGTTG